MSSLERAHHVTVLDYYGSHDARSSSVYETEFFAQCNMYTCIALYSITAKVSLMANTALCTVQYVRKPGLEPDADLLNKHEQRSGSSSFAGRLATSILVPSVVKGGRRRVIGLWLRSISSGCIGHTIYTILVCFVTLESFPRSFVVF